MMIFFKEHEKQDKPRKIVNRAEIFLSEKIANALGRFGSTNGLNPFEYQSEILEITSASGSSVEYFRSLNPDVFSYQISLNADVIDSAENIERYSLALMGAVEILWKNADKRNGKLKTGPNLIKPRKVRKYF